MHTFNRQIDGRAERPWQYRALYYMQSHGKMAHWSFHLKTTAKLKDALTTLNCRTNSARGVTKKQ